MRSQKVQYPIRSKTVSVQDLKKEIRENLTKFRPKGAAEMVQRGTLDEDTQAKAIEAQSEMDRLIQQGYKENEAREVVRAEFLKPEEPDAAPEWERAELEQMESEYRANPPVSTSEDESQDLDQ